MDVQKILSRYHQLKAARDGAWLGVWRDVRRFVYPTCSDFLSEGGTRGEDIFDTSAISFRSRLAAGMFSWMLDPTKRLIELMPGDEMFDDDDEIKEYFTLVTKIVIDMIANSNWQTVTIQMLNNIAAGIDGVVFSEDNGGDTPVNLKSFPIESICYAENSKGRVDTVFRELVMTSGQMVQEFDEKMLPEIIREEAADPKRQDKKHRILHAVFPRRKREAGVIDNKNMPFADVYIEIALKHIVCEGGFEEFPFCVCRFEKADNENYGRGPGLNKLPDIKMLNRMRQAYIIGSEHATDPDTLVPDGSIETGAVWNKTPGAVHVYKTDANGAKPEYMQFPVNLNQLAKDILEERQGIKEGFFLDIFDPLGDLKNITATEAEIRNESKVVPFAPIVGNVHSDYLAPMVHRFLGIAGRRGLLPEPPERLRENPTYRINYVSKIALAIKKVEALGWLQTEAGIGNIVALKPEVMDNFDEDKIVRDVSIANGINPGWRRPEQERDEIRQARADQQAQLQQAEMLSQGAALVPGLAKAPEPGSPLSALMNGGE